MSHCNAKMVRHVQWPTIIFITLGVVNIFFLNFKCFIPISGKQSRIKFSWSKLNWSCSLILDLLEGGLENMLGAIKNLGRWWEIVALRLPDNESGKITFVNMLSISVCERPVILAGYKMYGKKEFDTRESQNSLWTL